jgi:hypothetical protein
MLRSVIQIINVSGGLKRKHFIEMLGLELGPARGMRCGVEQEGKEECEEGRLWG